MLYTGTRRLRRLKQVKKNSSSPNQWGEEESFSRKTMPGPSRG
jgi:hypothetical protein